MRRRASPPSWRAACRTSSDAEPLRRLPQGSVRGFANAERKHRHCSALRFGSRAASGPLEAVVGTWIDGQLGRNDRPDEAGRTPGSRRRKDPTPRPKCRSAAGIWSAWPAWNSVQETGTVWGPRGFGHLRHHNDPDYASVASATATNLFLRCRHATGIASSNALHRARIRSAVVPSVCT